MSADQPADPNPQAPTSKPRRSYFSKTANAQKRKADIQSERVRALTIPILSGEVVEDSAKQLSAGAIGSAAQISHPSSSQMRGQIIRRARELMIAQAEFYVQSHIAAVQKALKSDDSRALETARRASEWALESISEKTDTGVERVIDRTESASDAPIIQIGIALGGLPDRKALKDGTNV